MNAPRLPRGTMSLHEMAALAFLMIGFMVTASVTIYVLTRPTNVSKLLEENTCIDCHYSGIKL